MKTFNFPMMVCNTQVLGSNRLKTKLFHIERLLLAMAFCDTRRKTNYISVSGQSTKEIEASEFFIHLLIFHNLFKYFLSWLQRSGDIA